MKDMDIVFLGGMSKIFVAAGIWSQHLVKVRWFWCFSKNGLFASSADNLFFAPFFFKMLSFEAQSR